MTTYSKSLVPMPTAKVKELAEARLRRINADKARMKASYIRDRTQARNQRWYRRLLRLKPLTEEQVADIEEQEHRSSFLHEFAIIKMSFWEADQIARRLLVACTHSPETVLVHVDDLYQL